MKKRMRNDTALIALLCMAPGLLQGCANVKSYEREILSDPIMEISSSGLTEIYEQHMHRALSQGLIGMPAAGGGCGCEQ